MLLKFVVQQMNEYMGLLAELGKMICNTVSTRNNGNKQWIATKIPQLHTGTKRGKTGLQYHRKRVSCMRCWRGSLTQLTSSPQSSLTSVSKRNRGSQFIPHVQSLASAHCLSGHRVPPLPCQPYLFLWHQMPLTGLVRPWLFSLPTPTPSDLIILCPEFKHHLYVDDFPTCIFSLDDSLTTVSSCQVEIFN